MRKNKLIQVRLNDDQFKEVIERAEENKQSVSEFIRETLLHSIADASESYTKSDKMKIPVFHRPEFLKTLVWIYSKRNPGLSQKNSIDEAKRFLLLLNSFLDDLDPDYLVLFINVKKDLEQVIAEYSPLFGVTYGFTKSYHQTYFNYETFENQILKHDVIPNLLSRLQNQNKKNNE